MKIDKIEIFRLSYKLKDTEYNWSRGHSVANFDSIIVKITSNEGLEGFGEICPLGSAYMEAYSGGVIAGIKELGYSLLGMDPTNLKGLNLHMDNLLGGHNYIKSPLDMACWDILGKSSGFPLVTLMGGKLIPEIPLYRAISQNKPSVMVEDVLKYKSEGYKKFQLKAGGNVSDDISRILEVRKVLDENDVLIADANTGWSQKEAIRLVNSVSDIDVYIEQPCKSLNECQVVREHTNLPMILDEVIRDEAGLLQAYVGKSMDVVNIKISRVGGLTKAVGLRNLCEKLGIAMTLEDSWGGDITTSAIAHLAGSTDPEFHFSSTDFNSYIDLHIAENAPRGKDGLLKVPEGAGLGISVTMKSLGEPLLVIK